MVKNNLQAMEQNLRSIAKRYKSVKYSIGLVILFLMMGVGAFSQDVMTTEEIAASRETLKNSVGNLQDKINTARKESQKEINGLRLELIQLMEQGNQVVKSPWASWQFGANYMYNHWGSTYKGRGDKSKEKLEISRKQDPVERFKASSQMSSTYGNTTLDLVYEPPKEVEISAGIRPKEVNKQAPTFEPPKFSGALPPFEPKLISPPTKPTAPAEVTPIVFNPPDINFKGKGFGQGAGIGTPKTNIVIQNYDSYDTVDKITNTAGVLNIEVGNLPGGTIKSRWWGSNLDGTANPNVQMKGVTNVPSTATAGLTRGGFNPGGAGTVWLGDGSSTSAMNAFINELRDHDATISGNYVLTNKGGEGDINRNIIFLSHNPAGVGGGTAPGTPGGPYDGQAQALEKTATLAGTLTLHGTATAFTGSTASSDVTIGVEHQLWSRRATGDWVTEGAYSTFNNTGKITLASGNNLVGILIDVEAWGDDKLTDNSGVPHKTKNSGTIEITEAENSIGIDYGEYSARTFKSELTVGNIIVGGKNNYGLRMANIFPGNTAYFDKGVTIKSGGADKKILVQGKQNVGVSIAKFLSSTNNVNPIAGITEGLNIEVAGEKNIGFLRHKTYANNTGDMIFDATTMGTFTFGDKAKDSTLIRTDKYGIQVKKDITATGKDNDGKDYTGNGNTVLHSNGETQHIHNYNTITIGKGYSKTVGMAATGTVASKIDNIVNEGTISLQGKQSIGMYVDQFTKGKSTGSIKLSGVGDTAPSGTIGDAENVGISNKGKFTFLGDVEVNGKKSSGIYNTGTMTIGVGTNPTDKTTITTTNGATAIYSKGNGSTVTSSAGDKLTINVNAGTTKEGLAVYAEDKSQVDLKDANINVIGAAAGVASYGSGTNVNLNGTTLKYNGEGYAVYSDGQGKIDLTNSKIELRGSSTLMELDLSIPVINRPITTAGTEVKVFSNDVVAINVSNLGTKNITDLATLNSSLGVDIKAGTESGTTYNKYKELAIENGTINFNVATDKTEADTSAGGFFFKKVLGQRLKLNVNENLTARLSSTVANEFYNGQVVGLEANSSKKAVSNNETQVNIASGKTVDVARTDGTDKGGVGVFVNYGLVKNDGTINIEKDSAANSNGVGVYAVNGSEVTNNGTIDVSGKEGIGLLGVTYRLDSNNEVVIDEFGPGALGQGKINITNKGTVNLDGDNATGIFVKNNKSGTTFTNAVALNDTTGVITTTGTKAVGISGEGATVTNNGTINVNGQAGTGMFAKSSSVIDPVTKATTEINSKIENNGTINLVSSTSADEPNIGMYTSDEKTVIYNNKDIIGGNNTYGIYGKKVELNATGKVKVGDNSVGIYSNGQHTPGLLGSTVYLPSGSKIEVGNNQSVGVFTTGTNQIIGGDADMQIGDSSYGYVIKGTGTQLKTDAASGVTLGNDAVYVYSSDTTGNIENKTALTATGSKNYGIYAAGTVTNLANMNFGTGVGNVGMYSIGGGTLTNGSTTVSPTITVSGTDIVNKLYGIGMAAGYVDDAGTLVSTGNIVNYGTIKVEKDNGIGMFATGSGSTATNRGIIELSGKNTTGMYLDNNAIGYNYGTITTVPNPSNDGIIGVVAANGAIIKNYGTINIIDGSNLTGVFINKGTQAANYDDQIPGGGTGVLNGPIEVKKQSATGKTVAGINIVAPGDGTATIFRDGARVTPIAVDTATATPQPTTVNVGTTSINLTTTDLGIPSLGQASSIGMYVDTSGVNYTNPIQGLHNLTGLKKVDLIFGTEASKYTNEKDIEVGENILKPYNDVISTLSSGTSMKFSFASGSLTWIATATQNTDDTLKALYLSKIPYTAFSSENNTNKFLAGLEQRYGVEGTGTREKALFDKLNGIGKGEAALFAQAVDQMKGNQYSNIQQRIQGTGNVLDKEFEHLRNDWSNPTKDSNKLKVIGVKGEYKTDTAGVEDYKYNAHGVAYVHEDETVKLGESIGWYAGVVENKLKFKDLGNSKEDQLQGKVGLFKSVPFDENNSFNWTISGDIFVGYNKMNRKFLVVDEVFGAKSRYYTYGIGVKNEISKSFRLSEGFSFIPHAGLKIEYGRFSKIKEKSGEMRLEVKANDYISIKPEVGAELAYKYSFGNNNLKVSVGVAYENELGKVANANNKAKVADTAADWYNLRGEKEDRKGNVKSDLNIGWDNQKIGVTANVGYDTKGSNIRGGVGLRFIF